MSRQQLCLSSLAFLLSLVLTPPALSGVSDNLRAQRAAAHLVRSQLPSGFFPYDFNFADGSRSDMENMAGYNLVRQAGAASSLSEYLLRHPDDDAARQALARFLTRVSSLSLPIGKGDVQELLEQIGLYNRWQLWKPLREPLDAMGLLYSEHGEGKLVSVAGDYERAWPGATALSLLSALNYRTATGDSNFDKDIRQWKDGLFALHVPGRGLREAPHYLSESAYVNAEAWLALAAYNRVFPTETKKGDSLNELESYLFDRYGSDANSQFYSWGTMAAAVRAESTGREVYLEFMHQLAVLNLPDKEKLASDTNSCAPLEGLATFVSVMQETGHSDDQAVSRARLIIERQLPIIRALQIDPALEEVSAIATNYHPEWSEYRGAFILSEEEPLMQVDLTQHCLNALLILEQAGMTR